MDKQDKYAEDRLSDKWLLSNFFLFCHFFG